MINNSVLYIGDFIKMNGPSMVDINLTKKLDDNMEHLKREQINKNIDLHFFKKILKSESIHVSGVSIKGMLGLILGRILFRKTFLTMHGALKEEKNYRKIGFCRFIIERIEMFFSDKIIAVSKKHKELIEKKYLINYNKLCYINNGIDLELSMKNYSKNKFYVFSVGGGRREKNILNLCKAIELINNEKIVLFVAGEEGEDSESIEKYDFVQNLGFISHVDVIKHMEKSNIFVQISEYEPFGLAPLEALMCKCNLILSNKIGMLSIFEKIPKYSVWDLKSIEDLKELIQIRLTQDNYHEFLKNLNFKSLSWDSVAKDYLRIWTN